MFAASANYEGQWRLYAVVSPATPIMPSLRVDLVVAGRHGGSGQRLSGAGNSGYPEL